jgi:CMP-N-acetylneuraminic acid synthetase
MPLMVHTILCPQARPVLTRVVTSTDDEQIAAVAKKWGVEVPFMRPAYLAQDDSSKWAVFRHLVSTLEQMDNKRIDVLVDLDTGVPMRTPGDIKDCVELLLSSDPDVVTTAYEAERNPYFNMVEEQQGFARIVKLPDKPIASRRPRRFLASRPPSLP